MAAPATPTSFFAQNGDGSIFLSWDITSGATSYVIQRSLDGVNFTTIQTNSGAPLYNYYLDNAYDATNFPSGPKANTIYYYQVNATNGSGSSPYTSAARIIPTVIGKVSLAFLRFQVQSRSDRINSTFVTVPEYNQYITESRKFLYNLLTECYGGDYYSNSTYTITTVQNQQTYTLPADFFKATLVEVSLNPVDPTAWVTLRRFNFIQKNLWNYPNVYTFYGITNIRYRFMGDTLYIVPVTTSGQTLRINYVPRPGALVQDTDLVDGISGFEELIINSAASMALAKEESDSAAYFQGLVDKEVEKIMSAAENRDIGEPNTVSDSKTRNFSWGDDSGQYGGPGGAGGL